MPLLEPRTLRRLIRAGAGLVAGLGLAVLLRRVWFQQARGETPIPPWPEGDATDPLEEPFGRIADNLTLLTPEELAELRRGGTPTGVRPDPDLSQPGNFGDVDPTLPSVEWPDRQTYHMPDGRWERRGDRLPPCGEVWLLGFEHFVHVPTCAGINFAPPYRATLLRAIAEAFRCCRERDPQCPNARIWLLRAGWLCTSQPRGPLLNVYFKFAVACVAA